MVLVALLASSGAIPAGAAPVPSLSTGGSGVPTPDNRIFAGGGTQLSNGVFFPGPAECDRKGCSLYAEGSELEIERGENILFSNLDVYESANAHSIVSIKNNKRGRPLFSSPDVKGPEEVSVKTKHLKPGDYPFFCRTHYGMYGIFKVIKPQ